MSISILRSFGLGATSSLGLRTQTSISSSAIPKNGKASNAHCGKKAFSLSVTLADRLSASAVTSSKDTYFSITQPVVVDGQIPLYEESIELRVSRYRRF